MSQQADLERSRRRHWAAAGGRHDRVVRALQLSLPALVGALAAVMLLAPFSRGSEISFLVAKDSIEVAGQRVMVDQAMYRGNDSQGRRFTLSADNALQRSAADPVVRMRGLTARLDMAEGPAMLNAEAARYNPTNDMVYVDGPLRFSTADGYRLDTGDVAINLKARSLSSGRPVTGVTNIGRFSAGSMRVDLDSRIVHLSGNTRIHINQGLR
ncbi:MAG: LPS export ABC transporter periplasmic protein LptC [Sphingopyxis sp.]